MLTFARRRFAIRRRDFARLLALLADVLMLGRGDGGLCSFARNAKTRKAKVRGEAEQEGEAMDYLLKPSPLFVAGLTLGIAIAKATAVAKIRIKQFWAIPLTGKVVAGPCMMAMPGSFSYAKT